MADATQVDVTIEEKQDGASAAEAAEGAAATAAAEDAAATDAADGAADEDIVIDVVLKKDSRGLGLKIALSKAKYEKPPVLFINGFARLNDGSVGEAERENKFALYDILTKVNGKEVGTDLKLVGGIIKECEVDSEITFTVTRHSADERERLKEIADQERAENIETQLLVAFRKAAKGEEKASIDALDEVLDRAAMDNIGLHLPSKPLKEMDAFKAYVDESINWVTFEEAMLSGTALECRTTRSAHYAAVFAELDTDKSGSISLEEFTSHASDADSLFNKYFKDLASNISESFAKMDKDKSNSLSWEEFVGCAEEAFAATLHPKAAQELEAAVEVAVTPFDEALKNKAEPTTASEASNDDDAEEEQKQVEEARAEMEKIKEEQRKKDAAEYLERKKKEKEEAEARKAAEAEEEKMQAEAPKQGGCCVIA